MTNTKAKYVDGYVLVVPKKNVAKYRKMAQDGLRVWMKFGALDYKESIGDDLDPDMGGFQIRTFPKLAKLKRGETVWFSFITYKSKKHRDLVNKKVAAEMERQAKKYKNFKMPFDMKRMSFGGFRVMVGS
jgi:uncharacterized protein YbaA (DUF1428 family)